LRTLAEQIQQLVDFDIQIREIGNATNYLDTSETSVVFHIIEEALSNARKYSEANLVEVRLWVEDDLFVAQVADDGVGFDAKEIMGNYESRGSLGMVNMRERAALINGSLDVKSAPEQGTTITLVVPLKKADSD
jgi:signal transduction histidine kinase